MIWLLLITVVGFFLLVAYAIVRSGDYINDDEDGED